MTVVRRDQLERLCEDALLAAGASPPEAAVLATATADAEFIGNRAVGVAHLPDYLDGYRQGRITADAPITVDCPRPSVFSVDAGNGLAQNAFAHVVRDFTTAVRAAGVAALWVRRSFTCGELGHYPRQLARAGLICMAMANSPALMSLGGSARPVLGTNPLAFGIPRPGALPLVVDQASSGTAFVSIREAAAAGVPIPDGWAVDKHGRPTTDAAAALNGSLLPFGGHRGGNVALLIELLSTLSGANPSLAAPPFDSGTQPPGIGLFIVGVDPEIFPGAEERVLSHMTTLVEEHGVWLPALDRMQEPLTVEVDSALLAGLRV